MMNNNLPLTFLLIVFTAISIPTYAAIPIKNGLNIETVRSNPDKKDKKTIREKNDSPKANTALVLGILGLVLFPPLGIIAVIYGALSLTNKESRKKQAIWGLVTGGLAMLYTLALTGLLIAGIL